MPASRPGESRGTGAAWRGAAAPPAPQVRGRLRAGRPPRVPRHASEGEHARVRRLREVLRQEQEPGQAPEDSRGRQAFPVPGLRPELQRLVQPRGPPEGPRGREAEPVCRVRCPRRGPRRPEPLRGCGLRPERPGASEDAGRGQAPRLRPLQRAAGEGLGLEQASGGPREGPAPAAPSAPVPPRAAPQGEGGRPQETALMPGSSPPERSSAVDLSRWACLLASYLRGPRRWGGSPCCP